MHAICTILTYLYFNLKKTLTNMSYFYRSFVLLVCTIISHSTILLWQWAVLGILHQRDTESQNAAKPFKFIMFHVSLTNLLIHICSTGLKVHFYCKNPISFMSRFLWPHQNMDVKIPGVFAAVTQCQLWIQRYKPLSAPSHGILAWKCHTPGSNSAYLFHGFHQ